MLRNIATYMSAIGGLSAIPAYYAKADITDYRVHEVNESISVLSTYYGALSKSQSGKFLEAEVAKEVQDGDMLLMFIATSGGLQKKLPHGFEQVLQTVKDKGDLTLTAAMKIWRNGDSPMFPVEKTARNYFVTLLTIRGPKIVLDRKARINTAGGSFGEAFTPRVETVSEGAIVSAFAYDDPHAVNIQEQETLVSMRNGDDGLAVGISASEGGLSKRIRAVGDVSKHGGGDDIAMVISLY